MRLKKEGQLLQTVLNSTDYNALVTLDITAPSVLKGRPYFHSVKMVEKAIQA